MVLACSKLYIREMPFLFGFVGCKNVQTFVGMEMWSFLSAGKKTRSGQKLNILKREFGTFPVCQ